jgi:hypothetical protein
VGQSLPEAMELFVATVEAYIARFPLTSASQTTLKKLQRYVW